MDARRFIDLRHFLGLDLRVVRAHGDFVGIGVETRFEAVVLGGVECEGGVLEQESVFR